MSYKRVIPRDLFNEADLLKMLGKLYLELENLPGDNVKLKMEGDEFDISQDPSTGSISAMGVILVVDHGSYYEGHSLWRPLNTRNEWRLYFYGRDDEDVFVFNNDGSLSDKFLKFISK